MVVAALQESDPHVSDRKHAANLVEDQNEVQARVRMVTVHANDFAAGLDFKPIRHAHRPLCRAFQRCSINMVIAGSFLTAVRRVLL